MDDGHVVEHFVESVVRSILSPHGIVVRLTVDGASPALQAQCESSGRRVSVRLADYELSDQGIAALVADIRTRCA